MPAVTGRPAYHPAALLKVYVYGYLNRVQSSRRLEREAQRNIELMWLTGRLTPDFKTIADFRKGGKLSCTKSCTESPLSPLAAAALRKRRRPRRIGSGRRTA